MSLQRWALPFTYEWKDVVQKSKDNSLWGDIQFWLQIARLDELVFLVHVEFPLARKDLRCCLKKRTQKQCTLNKSSSFLLILIKVGVNSDLFKRGQHTSSQWTRGLAESEKCNNVYCSPEFIPVVLSTVGVVM